MCAACGCLDVFGEGAVVVVAVAQAAVDEAHQFYGGAEAQALVALAEYVLIEDVAQALLVHRQA